MFKVNYLSFVFSISILFISFSLHAQGPWLKDGKWEAVFSEEMNNNFDEQIKMLDALAKSEPSMNKLKEQMLKSLAEARKPKIHYLSEEQADRGVISIFEEGDKATKESGIEGAACKHEIEWLEKRIGSVTGKCEDGSIIKGEVSVPSDVEIHYKATVTPADDVPYPVGWDAKWVDGLPEQADEIY